MSWSALKERRVQVLAGGVALSVLFGFVGGSHVGHFDSALFATVGAAFGTTALAYVTWIEVGNGWAREWAAQRPLVYPRLPNEGVGGAQDYLKLKNGGRGPALNVQGELILRQDEGDERWGGLSAGALAAGDEEIVRIAGPQIAPPWSRISGELRYGDLVEGTYVTRFEIHTGHHGGGLELVVHPQEHHPRRSA